MRMFAVNTMEDEPVEAIRDVLLQCSSIEEAHRTLSERNASNSTVVG